MANDILDKSDLTQFTGSEVWYRHPCARDYLYTEGILYLAEKAGAYWLIDEIVYSQKRKEIAAEEFQVWNLKVNLKETTAFLTCEDGNYNVVYGKKIIYTDFPLDEIRIYLVNNVIHLPSEY